MADNRKPDGIVLTEAQKKSRRQRSIAIALALCVLVAVAIAPWPLGYFDAVYGVTSILLGAGMLAFAVNVYRRRARAESLRATRKLFAFSILYLFALFATLALEVLVHTIAPSVW